MVLDWILFERREELGFGHIRIGAGLERSERPVHSSCHSYH